jgi:hypothetical protein
MCIGGVDVLLQARTGDCIADVILRACSKLWEHDKPYFQDAGSTEIHALSDPWVWRVGTASREFMVYKDRRAVEQWRIEGATRRNENTMLHFLIGGHEATPPGIVEVALVCDRLTPAIRQLARELQTSFLPLRKLSTPRRAG